MGRLDLIHGPLLFDAEDAALILPRKWHSFASSDGKRIYAATTERGRRLYCHRLLIPDAPDVDHINRNGLDNRRANLRPATRAQNMANSSSRRGSSSQYKGVFWWKQHGRWTAKICPNGKQKYLGLFDSEEEAARAYDRAALAEWGDFAHLNFP